MARAQDDVEKSVDGVDSLLPAPSDGARDEAVSECEPECCGSCREVLRLRPALAAALSSAESARRVVEDLVRLSEGAMRDANRDGAEYQVEECLAEARAFLAGERGEVDRG